MPVPQPSASPTISYEPTVSYNPTFKPTSAPSLNPTTPFMAVNQTLNNIVNMSWDLWTVDSKNVMIETITQVLYNYELCIEKVEFIRVVAPSSLSSTELSLSSTTISSSLVYYNVFYDPAIFGKSAGDMYTLMSATLAQSVQQGSFDSILHLEASYYANTALAAATSGPVFSSLVQPSNPSSSSSTDDNQNKQVPTLDESIGITFACVFTLFVSSWFIRSRYSRSQRARGEEF
jgi:hypothetical protein